MREVSVPKFRLASNSKFSFSTFVLLVLPDVFQNISVHACLRVIKRQKHTQKRIYKRKLLPTRVTMFRLSKVAKQGSMDVLRENGFYKYLHTSKQVAKDA